MKKISVRLIYSKDLQNASHTLDTLKVGKTKVYMYNDEGLYYTIYFSLKDFDNDVRGIALSDYDNKHNEDDYEDTLGEIHDDEIRKAVLKHEKKLAKGGKK